MVQLLMNQLSIQTLKESQEEADEYKKIITDMTTIVASVVKDIIPDIPEPDHDNSPNVVSPKVRSPFPFFSGKNESKNNVVKPVTSYPLTLVCTHAFQVFPWELLLPNEVVVRYISLCDAVKHVTAKPSDDKGPSVLFPQFVSVYHSQGEKTVAQLDASRRDTLSHRVLHSLRISPQPPASQRFACTPYPFHTPLIRLGKKSGPYKRKYKYLDFVDLSDPLQDLSKFVDSTNANYPIFLLTFADLLDSSQMVQHLLRSSKCPIIFVPGGKMKAITTKLVKLQDLYIKQHTKSLTTLSRKDRYQYLMALISILQEDQSTPIAIFNPPV